MIMHLGGAPVTMVAVPTLVARVFSARPVKVNSLEIAFGRAKPLAIAICPIVRSTSNVFLVEFSSMVHLKSVLCCGPWSFDS